MSAPGDADPRGVVERRWSGWIYHNPDTGTELSENHPVRSGECGDAENIRPATREALRDELLSAWRALAEQEGDHTERFRDLAADRDRLATSLAASEADRAALERRVAELTETMHDAIVRPSGVVPESAQALYNPASATRAEARRPPFGSSQDRQERHYAEACAAARALKPGASS